MEIRNIIFDLGGVILDIDYQKTVATFRDLGFPDFDKQYTQAQQSGIFDDFEIGKMTPLEFVESLKKFMPHAVSNQAVIDAWNALLLSWTQDRIDFISGLGNRYQLFLFSNTNQIHKACFEKTYLEQINSVPFDSLFIKTYYSHEFGKRKPHKESYEAILREQGLLAEETLFIDDSIQHVEGAKLAGLQAIHLRNKTIMDLGL